MKFGKKMKVPPDLLTFIQEEHNFFIATHINPEPDAIGSSLALSMALESLGKKTILYDRDPVPELYRFLPGQEKFTQSMPSQDMSHVPLILLDCNNLSRAGIKALSFKYSAVIDHHETENDFGDIRWITPDAAATGIMIYHLLKELGTALTKEIAINLYAAIAIDTGTFRYNNTNAEVLRIAAELIEAGANPSSISNNLYETWSEKRFSLLVMALNTLEIRDDIAMIVVTEEMFRKTGTSAEDTENFPSFPRMMKDIRISAFFRQVDINRWKVSLRSRGEINVAKIATHFNGGGHRNAAGYFVKGSLESVKKSFFKSVLSITHSTNPDYS